MKNLYTPRAEQKGEKHFHHLWMAYDPIYGFQKSPKATKKEIARSILKWKRLGLITIGCKPVKITPCQSSGKDNRLRPDAVELRPFESGTGQQ